MNDRTNDRGTITGDTVRFERLLPGPIERVWSYLTEGPQLKTWLAEDGAIPPHVGATFTLQMGGGDDMPEREGYSAAVYGKVLAYDRPRSLEYTWGVRNPEGKVLESVVRFDLEPRGDRVALVLTHRGVLPGFETRTLAGWHQLLDALQARVEGREQPPAMERFNELVSTYEKARA
jgi:uncharacterized protein YndB with AHSA1/START domain